jgi:4'-phosphopantetheinyl transferase
MTTIRPPLSAPGPDSPWERVHDELVRSGSVLVYGTMPGWQPDVGTDELRVLLGRDWARYQKLSRPGMRERFLASRLFVRYTAAAAVQTLPQLVDLAYLPGGRPYVRGLDQIDISLSHTDETMVVGVTRRGRIGVDVERADRRLAHTGSEAQACTPFEKRRLDRGGDSARNDTMVRLWTLKEAYSKALGQGLRFRFTEFGFALHGESGARLVRPDGSATEDGGWTFGTFAVGDRHVVSVAVLDTGFGELADVSVGTTLDEGLLDALFGAGSGAAPAGSGNPAGLFGDADGVDAVAGAELADDRGEVVTDGALGEIEAARDLGGVGPAGRQP